MISFGPLFGNIIKEYQLYSLLKDKDQVFLLLGGNLGQVPVTFSKAIRLIGDFTEVVKTSALYTTEAWGMSNAEDFTNQALLINTDLAPMALLEELKAIEQKLGRTSKTIKNKDYTSRTIDIDILLWGDMVMKTTDLTVPHPRMHLRNFTLVPLAELAPRFIHPTLNYEISRLLKECTDPLKASKI